MSAAKTRSAAFGRRSPGRPCNQRKIVTWRLGPVNMVRWVMKTTIEIPDPLFRKAKSRAAERGQTLKEFVAEALQARLGGAPQGDRSVDPSWMNGFGKLRRLHKETARIQAAIDDEFETVESEDRL